jgi:probable HAF family extracellular repeat protein
MVGLGSLPGGLDGVGYDVSADGSTVVGYAHSAASSQEAFIWDESNGMRELDGVLTAIGLDLTGWTLNEAYGISDDGRVIVGWGTNPDNDREAWIAVIPEPSTGLLLGFGLAGLAVGGRRSVR